MPNWKKVITSGSNAVLNEITSSGGILTSQDIMPDVDNTLSLGSSTQRFQLNGGTPVTVNGSGTPVTNDFARFTDANTIEGRSYSEVKTDLSLNNVENTALSTYTGNGGALDNQYIANGANYSTTLGTVTSVNSEGPDGGGDVSIDTDNISEGSSNLYYTDTRVKTKLNTEGVISGSTFSSPSQGTVRAQINGVNTDVDTGLQVADSPTFDSLTLTGDLTVLGTKTELQVTELNVEDKLIKVASGSANPAAANGAGIYIDGADVALTWNNANGRFQFDDDLHTSATLNIGQVSNAGTDTDKFLVLDSNGNVDFRTGNEVLSDIGAGSSTNQIHPIQLTIDTKAINRGHIPWSALSDLQPNPNRAFTTWIAPSDGYLEEVIVSPEQTNTTQSNIRMSLIVNGTIQGNTVSVAMAAAGTNKTFTFGSTNYSFTAGERLGIEMEKFTNTADLYNVMVIFRLNS